MSTDFFDFQNKCYKNNGLKILFFVFCSHLYHFLNTFVFIFKNEINTILVL